MTTFTRAKGTTGVAGNASLAYDRNGYRLTQTTTTNKDKCKTLDIVAFKANGEKAYETVTTRAQLQAAA